MPAGVYGYRVDAEVPMTRLRSGEMRRGLLTVASAATDPREQPGTIVQDLRRDGTTVFSVARARSALLTWCRATGGARIEPVAGTITAHRNGDRDAWEDRVLHALIPLLLADRGELVLHAAAVRTDAGAVALCGPSGRGKSTLAAVCAAGGAEVLAEDAAAVTLDGAGAGAILWPGPAGVRLDTATARRLAASSSSSVRGKQLQLGPRRVADGEPLALAAIIALAPRGGARLQLTELDDPRALAEVFPSVIRLEHETWSAPFAHTARLVESVPCYLGRLPDDLGRVYEAATELISTIPRLASESRKRSTSARARSGATLQRATSASASS
jgi:hypothetical protein